MDALESAKNIGVPYSVPGKRRLLNEAFHMLIFVLLLGAIIFCWQKAINPEVPHSSTQVAGSSCGIWSSYSDSSVGTAGALHDIFAASDTDIWAVGTASGEPLSFAISRPLIQHWDGTSWNAYNGLDVHSLNAGLNSVTGLSSDAAWAVGHVDAKTLILEWNGTDWSAVPSPSPGANENTLNDVVALSADNAWAVGWYTGAASQRHMLILHWDGTGWSISPASDTGLTEASLESITANSPDDIWAAGTTSTNSSKLGNLLLHWNGSTWSNMQAPAGCGVHSVAATSTNDVWAVGGCSYSTILHWSGQAWTDISTQDMEVQGYLNLTGVVALSANDVWAVGPENPGDDLDPYVAHWDGKAWSTVASPHPMAKELFYTITATPGHTLWVAGSSQDEIVGTRFAFTSKFVNEHCPAQTLPTRP